MQIVIHKKKNVDIIEGGGRMALTLLQMVIHYLYIRQNLKFISKF